VSRTPEEQKRRIVEYYLATTEASYLQNWSGESLGLHFGLADESTASLAESIANTNAFLAERAGVVGGTRVLDAGCGVGGSAIWLARERGARVVGISLVDRQIELARGFARERGVEGLATFAVRDMLETGFEDASFDVVWNIESLCHVADIHGYLAHVHALLVDGGRFACIDVCSGPIADADRQRRICEGWALAALRSTEEMASALADTGFVEIEVMDLTARALLSAQALEAMTSRALIEIRANQAFIGQPPPPLFEGHVRAALAMAQGMRDGTTSLRHVLARRPPRA
jgi:tocopherol O-methyltransferase